jgi:hypothetical protein
MITVSPHAAKRLASKRCRVCKGRGWLGKTAGGLLIACKCVTESALPKRKGPKSK